jgi:DNA/RNA-binding domain of Phe-tRNA-synthetase-like protein
MDTAGMTGATGDPVPREGWVSTSVAEEFPELAVWEVVVDAQPGRSPRSVRERLATLSNRVHGAQAIIMRQDAIPSAYRIFYRHAGLDPDATRTPVEAAVVERLLRGGFRSQNLVDDALLIALVETGVPVWALDDATLDGPLGVRETLADERLGRADAAPQVPFGRLVVADAAGPVAVLFAELAPGHGVTGDTARMRLFTVQVAGVPAIHVEEALWTCSSILLDD